jgi:hypothetical protein
MLATSELPQKTINGYTPQPRDSLLLLGYQSVNGQFANVRRSADKLRRKWA